MMADLDGSDGDLVTSVVEGHFVDVPEPITVVSCTPQDTVLFNAAGSGEPVAKRIKLDTDSLINIPDANSSVKAICLRLDAIENKLETVTNATKILEDKIEQLAQNRGSPLSDANNSASTSMIQTPGRDSASSTPLSHRKGGAVVVGLPQTSKGASGNDTFTDDEEIQQERYVVSLAGDNPNGNRSSGQGISNLGPNVTLITLNSEDDFPNGTWLGDENNPEMRVRVPVSPSDLLHVHSNCRTAEKMALTLLDYLFDRETQAYSNLSGMGKHGKKQLDPLMIYGIRCHLIHHFSITEQDWHRIKQNVNSKCRTAFRRKIRGLPLTVKAFRGKAPPTYIHVSASGMPLHHGVRDLGDASDDSLQHGDDTELQIQTEVDVSQAGLLSGTTEIIQSAGGHIQVLHATPEQVAQLQQTHQIQILQGDQIMQFHSGGDQESIHVAVPMSQADAEHIQVINSEHGETIQIGAHLVHDIISQDVNAPKMPKVEDATDSD